MALEHYSYLWKVCDFEFVNTCFHACIQWNVICVWIWCQCWCDECKCTRTHSAGNTGHFSADLYDLCDRHKGLGCVHSGFKMWICFNQRIQQLNWQTFLILLKCINKVVYWSIAKWIFKVYFLNLFKTKHYFMTFHDRNIHDWPTTALHAYSPFIQTSSLAVANLVADY